MKLHFPFIQLPLNYDAARLSAEIAALGETPWRPHPQGFPGNSMLPLVAVGGDPSNEAFSGSMAPTSALLRCPYLTQVLASLDTTVGRTRLMRLAGQAEVTRHADQGYYWVDRVRVHVPIVTQPSVRFECGDAAIHMAAGECWIFDTWRQHRVLNDAVESRIHLVVDTVGGVGFWKHVAGGRPHNAPTTGWMPKDVAPQPALVPSFALESVNVPAVMTPWEIHTHLGLLFEDAVPHPNLGAMQMICAEFLRGWRGLWAQYGESTAGKPHFRVLLERFLSDIRNPARPVLLKNELYWYSALMMMIGKVAVATDTADVGGEYGLADRA